MDELHAAAPKVNRRTDAYRRGAHWPLRWTRRPWFN